MSKKIVVLVAVMALILVGCGVNADRTKFLETDKDFLNVNLGATEAEIKSAETQTYSDTKELGEKTLIIYEGSLIENCQTRTVYVIEDGVFVNGIVYITTDDTSGVYTDLKAWLTKKYGAMYYFFDATDTNWMTDEYYITLMKSSSKVTYAIEPKENFQKNYLEK